MRARLIHLLDTFLIAVVVVLSGDLFYLYYAGVWHEPYPLIEVAEIVTLMLLALVGGVRVVLRLRKLHSNHRL